MRKEIILPIIIFLALAGNLSGLLDISLLQIKCHQLKTTILDYGWHYRNGDPFTAGETVQSKSYEDGLFSFFPNYPDLRDKDLLFLTTMIDSSMAYDHDNFQIVHPEYMINICLDYVKIDIESHQFFRKRIRQDVLGSLELMDPEGKTVLHKSKDVKINLQNEIFTTGWSTRSFLLNKLEEIWFAQMSQQIRTFIKDYKNSGERSVFRHQNERSGLPEDSKIQASINYE